MKPQLIVLFFSDAMILCVAGGLGQMSEWSMSCLVIFIDGETEAEKTSLVQLRTKLGPKYLALPSVFPSQGAIL